MNFTEPFNKKEKTGQFFFQSYPGLGFETTLPISMVFGSFFGFDLSFTLLM